MSHIRTLLTLVALSAALALPAVAQEQAAATPDSLAAGSASSARDYLAEIRANFSEEDRAYRSKRTFLSVVGPIYGIAMGLFILFTGLAARMRNLAMRATRRRYVHVMVFLALYIAVALVLAFPLDFYSGFLLEHQYDLSNQSFSGWFADQGKAAALTWFFFGVIPLIWLAYKAVKASRRWWLWLGVGVIPVIAIAALIQPIVIDPVFNDFKPLQDETLKTRVLALAEKADIPGRNVFQVDKSEQTKALNAYVNGFGASQRIVFWDTILEAMDHDELVFVTGHEMGHYVLGHIWQFIAFYSVLGFVLFLLTGKLVDWASARFGGRWGFTELHDIASLPLFAAAFSVASLVAQPLVHGFSRMTEHDADIFALEITHANDAGARAFLKLGSQNKNNPDPSTLETVWLYTHPPVSERMQFMLEYKPWETGEPNKLWKE